MLLVNLSGGLHTGKSTVAAAVYAYLKTRGVSAVLIGEDRKNLAPFQSPLLMNHVHEVGRMYDLMQQAQNLDYDVAIAEAPLSLMAAYSYGQPYHAQLRGLVEVIDSQFPNSFNVFIRREQDNKQADTWDSRALDFMPSVQYATYGPKAEEISEVVFHRFQMQKESA
ncbi:Uncharacterised protein [uncultured archaeon]|nr:Uncharacterised protein [uncultured archaeon]